jgi:Na+:H+ antiporter, NhaA family
MAKATDTSADDTLPKAPVDRLTMPVRRFLHVESSSGIVLLTCTTIALAMANSPAAEWYAKIWKTPVEFTFGTFRLAGDLGHLVINDGLMAIFFFVVGLEIKREIVAGELRVWRKASLPVFAALGGMVFPAGIYLAMQWGEPAARGWAIPMATDIAFVVGFLALFGRRVPLALKIMLLTLAIADDLGAVMVIAFVYTDAIAWDWIAVAAAGFGVIATLNRIGVRSVGIYVLVGSVIWLAVYKSGIHSTVAGVLLGLLTPASAWIGDQKLLEIVGRLRDRLLASNPNDRPMQSDIRQLRFVAREAVSPLHRLETALHPWVAFGIMPLFALANAGVALDVSSLGNPISVAVALGLSVGKPVGIVIFCWIAIRLGVSQMPENVNWPLLLGGACLAGIGFTMSLFINGLAFPVANFPEATAAGKIGTMTGSLVSAILGASILLVVFRNRGRSRKSVH